MSDLTERAAVLEAMRLHDHLGRDEFLRVHEYGPTRGYVVRHEGREYDSKAIAGVAYGIQHGVEVMSEQVGGGMESVARALERLGFEVPRAEAWDSRVAWETDEMLLALHWYLRFASETLDAEHPAVGALSRILERRANARGRRDEAQARAPAEIAAQLVGFGAIDPDHGHGLGVPPSRAHVDAWARWTRDGHARKRKVEELLGDLEGAATGPERAERRRRLQAAWGVEETAEGYRPRAERRADEGHAPVVMPAELLSPHQPGELRVEEPEPFDRANAAHEAVRSELVRFLEERTFIAYEPSEVARQRGVDFDLAADDGELRLVIEAKSLPAERNAEAARMRMGLGQVLWYRSRFLAVCGERRVAVLVVVRAPREQEAWEAVCRQAGVVLTWPERFGWLVEECRCAAARG